MGFLGIDPGDASDRLAARLAALVRNLGGVFLVVVALNLSSSLLGSVSRYHLCTGLAAAGGSTLLWQARRMPLKGYLTSCPRADAVLVVLSWTASSGTKALSTS